MTNKFIINEDEKRRILNLHEASRKSQHLGLITEKYNTDEKFNRSLQEGPIDSGQVVGNALVGFAAGGIIGSAVGVYYGLMGDNSVTGAKKILQTCSTKKSEMGQPTMNTGTLSKIADDINYGIAGAGTYEKTIASGLRQTKNIPNLCAMASIYKTRHGEGLFDAIDGDIDSPSQWKQYVFLPILDVYNASVELGKKAKQQQPKDTKVVGAPTSGEVYQKCHTHIIDPMVKKYGYTYVTLEVFNQAPADKKTYKWCPAGKSNVYFTKGWNGKAENVGGYTGGYTGGSGNGSGSGTVTGTGSRVDLETEYGGAITQTALDDMLTKI